MGDSRAASDRFGIEASSATTLAGRFPNGAEQKLGSDFGSFRFAPLTDLAPRCFSGRVRPESVLRRAADRRSGPALTRRPHLPSNRFVLRTGNLIG